MKGISIYTRTDIAKLNTAICICLNICQSHTASQNYKPRLKMKNDKRSVGEKLPFDRPAISPMFFIFILAQFKVKYFCIKTVFLSSS